jgi:hypothetical protein
MCLCTYDLIGRRLVELARVGILQVEHVPGVLYDGALKAQTNAQEGLLVEAGPVRRRNHALHASVPKATRHQDRTLSRITELEEFHASAR